jgi:hypothetical protein
MPPWPGCMRQAARWGRGGRLGGTVKSCYSHEEVRPWGTRMSGVESEMELAFAALQQLCAPMLDKLEGLPDPSRST